MIERIFELYNKFIFYHQRGLEIEKHCRDNSIYLFWSFLDDQDNIEMDIVNLWDIAARMIRSPSGGYDDDYETTLRQFDLMSKLYKNRAFI